MAPEPHPPLAADGNEDAVARIYAASATGVPLRQGELLTGLRIKRLTVGSVDDGSEDLLVDVNHPYVIVASQDCDLDLDHRARNENPEIEPHLPSILLYEVFTAEDLKSNRVDLNQGMKSWTTARQNKNERYHFLELVPSGSDARGEGLPELAIDFKRYLTVPTDELYARIARGDVHRRCRLESPFLEHWSFRHAAFQCRVALPRQHTSE